MQRVLLISANREHFPEPVFPLGASYTADALVRAGSDVRIVDAGLYATPLRAVRRAVAQFRPEVIGLSLRNIDNAAFPHTRSYIGWYERLARSARASALEAGGARVIIGGSAFAIFPREMMVLLGADGGAIGDGEDGAVKLCLNGNGPQATIVGRVDDLGEVAFPRSIATIFPAFRRYRAVGVQTARGCPHACAYCTYPLIEGCRVRTRPADAVADDIAFLHHEHGLEQFFIVDSSFNADEAHLEAVCRAIIARRLAVRLSCYLEPSMSDPGLFRLLAEAGCCSVDFGTDSGSEAVLHGLRKGFSVDDVRAAARACRDAGIDFCHSAIFGGPGETPSTVAETVRVMDETQPNAVLAMVGIRVYPGTEMERLARHDGVVAPGESLLTPRFYAAGHDAGGGAAAWLFEQVRRAAAPRRTWFLPGAKDWSGALGPRVLRYFHRDGPLWRAFPAPRWYKLV